MKKALFASILLLVFLVPTNVKAQELHTQSNAANPNTESDSVEGWGGTTVNTTVTNEVYDGNYAIKLEASTDGWARAEYTFATIPGERYKITIYAKSGTPVRQGFYAWDGFTDFEGVDNIVQEWTEYTWTLTASGTSAMIKVYTGHPSLAGDTVYIDNISIVKEDLQAPTAPTLSSLSHTASSVTLSWNGATDNVGVTGYKIFKDGVLEATLGNLTTYEVTGLTSNTPYQFTIISMDAYGNESPTSNAISVTTNSSGGGSGGSSVWTEANSVASYTGDVAVGTSSVPAGYKLAVEGKIRTREVRVDQDTWPDYVFAKEYDLPTLKEVEEQIQKKGHLINMPSAEEVETNGIELGEMNKLLLEKIEELTLYILIQEEKFEEQKEELLLLKSKMERLSNDNK